jgi:hypothetical protein
MWFDHCCFVFADHFSIVLTKIVDLCEFAFQCTLSILFNEDIACFYVLSCEVDKSSSCAWMDDLSHTWSGWASSAMRAMNQSSWGR